MPRDELEDFFGARQKPIGAVRCRICTKVVGVVERDRGFRLEKHRFVDWERDPCHGSNAKATEVKRAPHSSWIDYETSTSFFDRRLVERARRFVVAPDKAAPVVGVARCPGCGWNIEVESVGGKLVFPPHAKREYLDDVCEGPAEVTAADLLAYQDSLERRVRAAQGSEEFARERAAKAQRELQQKADETAKVRAELGAAKALISRLVKEVQGG
jgi:ribosomal protein S27E